MAEAPPLLFRYEGEGAWSASSNYMARRADGHYVIGAVYPLVEHSERSAKSHAHYFAQVKEYWQTLPDQLAPEFPTAEHLRKKALIRCGFATHTDYTFDTPKDAITFAAVMGQVDEYCIVEVKGRVCRRWQAQSQNYRAMNKEEFQKSKQAVLDFIDQLLGTARKEGHNVGSIQD